MRFLARLETTLLSALALIGAIATVALMAHVVTDVALRNLFNQPIPATYEIVTKYYMIALAFIPLAWVERGGGMVQVEVLDPLLGEAGKRWADRLVALISTLIYGALTLVTLDSALASARTGTFVMAQNVLVPTWPGFFLLPLGFALATVVTFVRIFVFRPEPGR
ncbi:MAG: TRAP transporter small permease [Azospirillaceae bacterium]